MTLDKQRWLGARGIANGWQRWKHAGLAKPVESLTTKTTTILETKSHMWRNRMLTLAVPVGSLSLVTGAPICTAQTAQLPTSIAASFGYTDHSVQSNGVRLHYVTVGKGEPVLLLPGWPESWYAMRNVMKQLAASGREVYVLDPRGFGDSDKPYDGYDLSTAANDIHGFLQATGLVRPGGIDIVSHDVGTWIAYAHASAYPTDVRRLVLTEAAIPWTTAPSGPPDDALNVRSWHFAFNRLDDLPEILVSGHERAYLTWLFDAKSVRKWVFDPASLDEYVRTFSRPGAARAGFAYYRQAFNESGKSQMTARLAHKLTMPVLAVGAEGGMGPQMLASTQPLAVDVRGAVLPNCGHYVADECPDDFVGAILAFWKQTSSTQAP